MSLVEPLFAGPALDVMEEVFFAFTPEGQMVQWNRRAREVTGYSDEEIAQMHPTELVAEEDIEVVRRHIEKVIVEGKTRFKVRYRTKEGELIPYEVTGSLLERDGQTFICGTGRDITEREKARREREASEKRYRAVTKTAVDAIVVAGEEGRIIDWNRGAAKIFGYDREEILGRPIETLMPERYKEPHRKGMERANRTGEGPLLGETVEIEGLRKSGEEFPLELSLSTWEIGDERYFAAIIRDITERKKTQESLRESEEKFRVLAEKALIGIALLREDKFLYVNPAFARITGREVEEVIGQAPQAVFHPEDRPLVRQKLKKRLEWGQKDAHYTARIQTKEGETRHVEILGTRIEYRGEPAIMGTVRDITEQRRMRREMLRIQEEERKRIGQDLHDGVASQLTGAVIILSTLTAEVETDSAKERLENVQSIIEESAGDVRRLSRGLNPGGLSEGDLLSALKGLADNTEAGRFRPLHSAGPNDYTVAEVEAPAVFSTVEAEVATHLYRIAQEATTNARKYAEADVIEIRLGKEGDALVLEVEDDGKGFDPSETDKEGLGLRSMRHRAELLGAEFTIESRLGEGTLVRSRLPA